MANNYSLVKVRKKFVNWWQSIIYCCVVYVSIFLVAKFLINYWAEQRMIGWLKYWEELIIFAVALTLGFLFIADALVSGYLKTPLARLANKVENCQFSEDEEKNDQQKNWLLTKTQEANELFKKTFEKFGILALPSLLITLLDNGKLERIKKLSQHPLFYTCYAVPMIYATGNIFYIHWKLTKLEQADRDYNPKEKNYE